MFGKRWISVMSKITARRSQLSVAGCVLLVVLLTAPFFMWDLSSHSYHVDEDIWVHGGYYYSLYFKDHNYTSPDWQGRDIKFNGTVGRYVLGFGVTEACGMDFKPSLADINGWWPANHHMPDKSPRLHPRILHAGRLTCAFLGALTAVWLFIIGYCVAGRLAGVCTSLMFATHPLVLSICRHAMGDAPMIFFVTLAVAVAACLLCQLREPRRHIPSIAVLAVLESVAIGCAVGSKMNGVLVGFSFALAMLIACVGFAIHSAPGQKGSRSPVRRLAGALGLAFLAAAIGGAAFYVYVRLNPFLHTAPIAGIQDLYQTTTQDLEMALVSFPNDRLKSFGEKVDYVFREVYLGRDMFLPQTLSRWVNGALGVCGVLALCWQVISVMWRQRPGGELVAWTWLIVSTTGVLLWIPVHWDRYLIPALACGAVASGLGLAILLQGSLALATRVVSSFSSPDQVRLRVWLAGSLVVAALAAVGLWSLPGRSAEPEQVVPVLAPGEVGPTPNKRK